MRRLPAALISVFAVLPALAAVAMSPDAGAASPSVAAGSDGAGSTVAGSTVAGIKLSSVPPKAVPPKISQLKLSGVDASALRALEAQARPSGTRGAPGASAQLTLRRPTVLTKKTAAAAFQTVGVSWKSTPVEPDLLISVRTRTAKGWSAWSDLDDDAGDDTTAAGPAVRGGTDPRWVGPSNGVQARIVVRSGRVPKDLKLELVNAGRSAYDATAASTVPASSSAGTFGGLSADGLLSASVARPTILSRAAWGADEKKVRGTPTYMPTIKATVLHHTAGPNNYSAAQVPSIIRGDYAYHLSRGWDDIGYNALVDRFGRVWEGRGGGIDRAVMGAHAGGLNTDTFGVAVIGNLDVHRPTAASITAITKVMAWKLDLNHRDPLGTTRLTSMGGGTARYKAGKTETFPVIMGHRNTGFTACPGRYLYPYLPSIRARVKGLIKAALINPTRPPSTGPRGRALTVSARSLAAQSWQLDVSAPCGGGRVARITGSAKAGRMIRASWNGKLADGTPARPGRYTLTLSSTSTGATARPLSYRSLVLPPAPVTVPPGPESNGAGGYQPVTPTRLLDTRVGGQIGLGPAGRLDIPVLGQAGVPATGVTAVVLNLTASCVSDETSLAVWPTGSPPSNRPVTDIPAGVSRSVLVTSRVGANGSVSVGNARGVTELTAEVVGYYSAAGSPVQVIDSTRLYDSRSDPAGPLIADQPRLIPLPATLGGVPSSQIKALIVDVGAVSPTAAGTLTAYRPGSAGDRPTLSYRQGESIDNLAIAEVSAGAIALKAAGSPVDAILDVRGVVLDSAGGNAGTGSLVGTRFTPHRPVLIVDTRRTGGVLKVGAPRKIVVSGGKSGIPAGASAVLIDLTGIAPAKATTLQVYSFGSTSPGGTALRVSGADTRGNLVVVPVGTGGAIAAAAVGGNSELRVDVLGYFK